MRLIAIRQARLEPLALSVSDRERMFNGWAAASEDKRIDFSARVAWFGDILNVEGSLMEIGPRSVFANSSVGQAVASGGRSAVLISAWATGPPAGVGGGLGPFLAA